MPTSYKLSRDDQSPQVDTTLFRSMIGSMLFLTASRTDIMQAVGMVVIFQACPKESHVIAVKLIFRYLKGTSEFGLWYPKNQKLELLAYIVLNLSI